jgi:epoxyqueuosine reductase
MHGSMEWMARTDDQRVDPTLVVPGARSVVIVAVNYHTDVSPTSSVNEALISRYAWGNEYHRVLGDRLESLHSELCNWFPELNARWYVDTGPVLEKAWAERAGLGWIGKHTNLINRDLGSWIFLRCLNPRYSARKWSLPC